MHMHIICIQIHSESLWVNLALKNLSNNQVQEQSKSIFNKKFQIVDEKCHNADLQVCKNHEITLEKMQELLTKYENLPEVQEFRTILDENNQNIFKGTPPDFKLEIPIKLSLELYLEVLETILEVVRHKGY